jgi:hypothetical protein
MLATSPYDFNTHVVFARTIGLKLAVVTGDTGTVIGVVVTGDVGTVTGTVVEVVVGTVVVAVLPQPAKPKINIETTTNANTFFIANSCLAQLYHI